MNFAILFEALGVGVFTRHDDEASARRHLRLLRSMNGPGARWSITNQGEEIDSSKPKPKPKAE